MPDPKYGNKHQQERKAWQRRLDAGEVIYCRRVGYGCLTPDVPIDPRPNRWDAGHPDETCPLPLAPEHRGCNRATQRTDRRAARVAPRRSRAWL